MKVVLFAARRVGLAAARLLRGRPELAALVVDAAESAAERAALVDAAGVPEARVFSSDRLDAAETEARLRDLGPDLGILAWWPYLVRQEIREIPRLGCLNFHPSLLPHNRGKHYNFWVLVEECPFGVTLHFIDGGVDSGDIAWQRSIDKNWEDTGATLYERAQTEIVRLFADHLDDILGGRIPRTPQDRAAGSFHRGAELEPASEIHLDRQYTARQLLNLLRARTFRPHPAAWFVEDGERFEVRVEIKKAP